MFKLWEVYLAVSLFQAVSGIAAYAATGNLFVTVGATVFMTIVALTAAAIVESSFSVTGQESE